MKGYILGIQSDNLKKKETIAKTHLWNTDVDNCIIENNICEFSFHWDIYLYQIKANTNNGFNYKGTIQIQGYEAQEINFCHYKNGNKNLLIGNYIDEGTDYRFIVEAS